MPIMVSIAQLVRASDCGSEGRGFETLCSPYPMKVIPVTRMTFLLYKPSALVILGTICAIISYFPIKFAINADF